MEKILCFPKKTNRILGGRKDDWYEFHRLRAHDTKQCLTLSYQLTKLISEGFLTRYIVEEREKEKKRGVVEDKNHEVPIL